MTGYPSMIWQYKTFWLSYHQTFLVLGDSTISAAILEQSDIRDNPITK